MSGDRERSIEAGMNDHLTKPINPDTLFATLLYWIPPQPIADENDPAALFEDDDADEIPPLDGIDTVHGLVNHLGRPALYRRILAGFNREFGATADDIDAALAIGDFALARRLAHSLKAAAATIGADELSLCVKKLEERYAVEEKGEAEFVPFVVALRRIVNALVPLAEEAQVRVATEAAPLADQLTLVGRLGELLRDDDAAAGRALDELEAALGDPRHGGDLASLRELVDDIEYDRALQVLERLRETLESDSP
jgi:HPt (histidine-containing phosphotransfer) domain-containing protein